MTQTKQNTTNFFLTPDPEVKAFAGSAFFVLVFDKTQSNERKFKFIICHDPTTI